MHYRAKGIFILFTVLLAGFFQTAHAQEFVEDTRTIVKARVLEVLDEEMRMIPGTDTETNYQTLQITILEGKEKDKELTVDNDYLNLKKGDVFYLMHTENALDGRNVYSVYEPYRLPALYFFIGLFVLCVLVFGGTQGLRGLLALTGSLFVIFFLLFPAILHGYSPLLTSTAISSLIIVLGSYITHGFNRTTSAAVIGMIATIILTGLLAYAAVHTTQLSGFETEEAVYLNFGTSGSIDFVGLLLGGIMIGLLGVLYDAAIGQTIAIEELRRVGPHLSRKFIVARAIRIGREHIGALVNTLAIAYVGASLPLLLLFYSSEAALLVSVNREVFATEIVRTMVGSIGLVLAVPITTFIGVFMVKPPVPAGKEEKLGEEKRAAEAIAHTH